MSTPDLVTSFLTYYVQSLAERTRVEKAGTKYGFDWIIYHLALADDLVPVRLPFLRADGAAISKTKTEAELGIDFAFLSPDKQQLTIFALKDEPLTNATWASANFDADLRMAVAPDLTAKGLEDVRAVRVILAYNKDEKAVGVRLFDNLVGAMGTRVGDHASLTVERWNLTAIVERVKADLLNPSLLPQNFFSLFSYIVAQAADLRHNSTAWEQHLLPTWRRFLDELLDGPPSERTVRLVSVALLILQAHGQGNPTFGTGFIDLAEWAMLALWRVHLRADKKRRVRAAISEVWEHFYLAHLRRFYAEHRAALFVEDGMDASNASHSTYLGAVGAACVAYWHLGRLGILAAAEADTTQSKANAGPPGSTPGPSAEAPAAWAVNSLVGFLNANPAAFRPLLDIHHVELFLIWNALMHHDRHDDIYYWLRLLEERLAIRRIGTPALPFLEGHNSLERVLEHAANGEKPADFMERSSYLLTMLLEFCLSLSPDTRRDELFGRIEQRLVKNEADDGTPFKDGPLDLVSWQPPADWAQRALHERISDGVGISVSEIGSPNPRTTAENLAGFVARSRQPLNLPDGVPRSVYFLACLKFASPLPPEFWRDRLAAATSEYESP